MQSFAYFCGKFDYYFTDTDDELVEKMCALLDDPENDTRDFELEDGTPILYWRRDGRIHGNIHGHDESDIPESSIANGDHSAASKQDDPPPF